MDRNLLAAKVNDRLTCVDKQAWNELFSGHPDSFELVRLIEDCGMEGFTFRSITISNGSHPVLLIPLFEKQFDLAVLTDGMVSRVARVGGMLLPSLLRPKLLGVGLVEGEWGQVGIAPGLSGQVLAQAWQLALDALERYRQQSRSNITLWLSFTPAVERSRLSDFALLPTYPCGRLALPFGSVDDYLGSLSKATRKDLRRKLRDAERVEITETDSPSETMLDDIERLYRQTVEHSEMSLGIHRRAFFARVGREAPGARYVIYRLDGNMIAFNLLVDRGKALVDKYFCMDRQLGPENGLYFVSWIHNVQYCIDRKIPVYHAGPGAEATKARLGARFVPSLTFFRHSNWLAHALLKSLRGMLSYKPQVDLTRPEMLDADAVRIAHPTGLATGTKEKEPIECPSLP